MLQGQIDLTVFFSFQYHVCSHGSYLDLVTLLFGTTNVINWRIVGPPVDSPLKQYGICLKLQKVIRMQLK